MTYSHAPTRIITAPPTTWAMTYTLPLPASTPVSLGFTLTEDVTSAQVRTSAARATTNLVSVPTIKSPSANATVPGVTQRADQVRAEIAETDRAYADSLAVIRHAADLTQVALAQQMGVPQTVVSRLEHQHDMLLSTLNGCLRAAGERPRVIVTINGHDVELDLATLVKDGYRRQTAWSSGTST